MVTLLLSVTAVTAVPALFASSEKAIEKVIAPSLSESEVETAQGQALLEPSLADTELSMVLPPPSFMVQVGLWMASEAVKLRVTVSPLLALPDPAVAMLTGLSVGAVKSMVTEPESAVVSAAPVFPAASTWLPHEKVAAPAVSSPLIVRVAVQDVPEPPIVAASPSMVHARDVTVSETVMVRVIVSPLLAKPELPEVVIAMFDREG